MTPLRIMTLILVLLLSILFTAGCLSENTHETPPTTSTTPVPVVTFIRPTIVQPQCLPLNQDNNTCCILINPVGKHSVGEVFEINGTTNLDVESRIILDLYEPEFHGLPPGSTVSPTPYYQYSGTKGYVKIETGANGINRWSYQVDLSGYHAPNSYGLHVYNEENLWCSDGSPVFIDSDFPHSPNYREGNA